MWCHWLNRIWGSVCNPKVHVVYSTHTSFNADNRCSVLVSFTVSPKSSPTLDIASLLLGSNFMTATVCIKNRHEVNASIESDCTWIPHQTPIFFRKKIDIQFCDITCIGIGIRINLEDDATTIAKWRTVLDSIWRRYQPWHLYTTWFAHIITKVRSDFSDGLSRDWISQLGVHGMECHKISRSPWPCMVPFHCNSITLLDPHRRELRLHCPFA